MQHNITFGSGKGEKKETVVWVTDLHLDAAEKERHREFFEAINSLSPDIVLVGGDISNGVHSLQHLKHLARLIHKPLYFVLGNHDFYYGSISKTRSLARQASNAFDSVNYLTGMGVIELTPEVGLIGHDGWADGRAGDFMGSTVMLNDYQFIDELKLLTPGTRLKKLEELGTEAANYLRKVLIQAVPRYSHIVLLIHTPPVS